MNVKKRKCSVCGENLTSKQYELVDWVNNKKRLCCPGKCAEKVRSVMKAFKGGEKFGQTS